MVRDRRAGTRSRPCRRRRVARRAGSARAVTACASPSDQRDDRDRRGDGACRRSGRVAAPPRLLWSIVVCDHPRPCHEPFWPDDAAPTMNVNDSPTHAGRAWDARTVRRSRPKSTSSDRSCTTCKVRRRNGRPRRSIDGSCMGRKLALASSGNEPLTGTLPHGRYHGTRTSERGESRRCRTSRPVRLIS